VRRIEGQILFSVKLIFWPLVALTLMALALQVGAWHTEIKIAGPFAAETNPARASLILPVRGPGDGGATASPSQELIHPVTPPLPFGFVFAPRLEKGASSYTEFIVPAEVLERHAVPRWLSTHALGRQAGWLLVLRHQSGTLALT
jgi:hypothetical protein